MSMSSTETETTLALIRFLNKLVTRQAENECDDELELIERTINHIKMLQYRLTVEKKMRKVY